MKKLFFATVFFQILLILPTKAQYYFYDRNSYDQDWLFEFGSSVSVMNCFTDLGGKEGVGAPFLKDFNAKETHIGGGFFASATYHYSLGLRLEGMFGQLSAKDEVLAGVTDIAQRRFNRNLNFKTNILEGSLMAEIHGLTLVRSMLDPDFAVPKFSPYLLGGVGYFSFNPKGKKNNGSWVELQPLSTEGQGFAEYPERPVYKLQQICFPFGGGVKYELGPKISARAEFVYRFLTTDYLDDCSSTYINPALFYKYFSGQKLADALEMNDRQIVSLTNPNGGSKRGDPKNKDSYFSFNLKLAIILGRTKID